MRSHRFTAIVRLLIQVDIREGPKTVAGSDAITISTAKPPVKAALKWLTCVTASVSTLLPHNRPDELSPLRANQTEHVHR